jgi:hypothetical protein
MMDLTDHFGGRVLLVVNAHSSLFGAQMKSVIRSPLMSRTKVSESWTRPISFANGRVIVTLSSLFLGSLVASLTIAEVTPFVDVIR